MKFKLNLQLFAHKKGVGSTKNGRDSYLLIFTPNSTIDIHTPGIGIGIAICNLGTFEVIIIK